MNKVERVKLWLETEEQKAKRLSKAPPSKTKQDAPKMKETKWTLI